MRAAGARVIAFPELSLTGYLLDAPALDPGDVRLAPLTAACAEVGALALAGAPVRGPGGEEWIAALAIDRDGARVAYRKLWPGEAEAARFSPGDSPAAVEVDGWRLGLAICRDVGVERHAADTAALGIDVYVAGTVKTPAEAGPQAERARRVAVEHGVWVAVASHAGPAGGGYAAAAAGSAIWSPDGERAAHAGDEPGAVARAALA